MNSVASNPTYVNPKIELETPHIMGLEFPYRFTVITSRPLLDDEVSRIAGTIGYALRATLAGEDLDEPRVRHTATRSILEFAYDTTKSQRSDPDFLEAFHLAKEYAKDGSPIRSTDRAGTGTKGTRLVEGVPDVELGIYFEAIDVIFDLEKQERKQS